MKARLNGVEFRQAIEQATHKICKELSLAPVTVSWDAWTPTAKINDYGFAAVNLDFELFY